MKLGPVMKGLESLGLWAEISHYKGVVSKGFGPSSEGH